MLKNTAVGKSSLPNEIQIRTLPGAGTYGYDTNGNQTSKVSGGVTTTFTYDALDRLTGIGMPVAVSYGSTGDGLRVSTTVGGVTAYDTWATLFGLPQVLADGVNEYVWGTGLIATVPLSGAPRQYTSGDALASTTLGTDGSGATTGTRSYRAFGEVRAQTGTLSRFGYTGQQTDAVSGLIYLRARYYDPATGRFLTKDPFPGYQRDPVSKHAYVYSRNSPSVYVDQTGRDACFTSGYEIGNIDCIGGINAGMLVVMAALTLANLATTASDDPFWLTTVTSPDHEKLLGRIFFSGAWFGVEPRRLGMTSREVRHRVEQLKQDVGVPTDHDIQIDEDGNAYDVDSGEPDVVIGNIHDYPPGHP